MRTEFVKTTNDKVEIIQTVDEDGYRAIHGAVSKRPIGWRLTLYVPTKSEHWFPWLPLLKLMVLLSHR